MSVNSELITEIKNLKKSLEEISVYDLTVYSAIELYYEIAKKLNEVIRELARFEGLVSEEVIKQNERLEYLLNEGLKLEVALKLSEFMENGTLQELVDRILFEDINNRLDGRVNIKEYEKLVINGDWSIAINTAISENEGREVFFPKGEYSCSTSINFTTNCKLIGVKGYSIIKLTSDNTSLFNYKQNNGYIEGLYFKGSGIGHGQVGLNLNVWDCTINDCFISHFDIGIDYIGVLVDINRCYIHNCDKGINIKKMLDYVPSTMLSLKKLMIHYNNIGIFASDDSDPNKNRPCIGLYIDECAFEHNQYAFKLQSILNNTIKNSWFEQNTNRPEAFPTNLILENNRYEYSDGKDQTIKYLTRETWEHGVYGGYNEEYDGYFSTKTIELQEYNSSDLRITDKKQLKLKEGILNYDNKNVVTTTSPLHTHYSIIVNKNGIVHTNIPNEILSFQKNSIGNYDIKLTNDRRFGNPLITTTFVNDDGGTEVFGITKLHFKDLATYLDWHSVDRINLTAYNNENKTPIDCKVMISIWCDKIY